MKGHKKIARNQTCPCGSGKKFKKCCLSPDKKQQENQEKHYFQLKGKKAEDIVHELSRKSFLTDWCYANQKLPNGKEICDLLIVFDDIAIIWQIKSLKLGDDGQYNKQEVEKNYRQLIGAKRRLFELDSTIFLENSRRGEEEFDPKTIKQIFLISGLMGPPENAFSFSENIKDNVIHVFDKEFIELALNELDTISDFCKYLKNKEILLSDQEKELIIFGGEEELLAYYIRNDKSFSKFDNMTLITIQDGVWDDFINSSAYKNKKKEDAISYGWDSIINRVHEGSSKYEIVARELARPNRFERRVLSKVFYEAHEIAHKQKIGDMYRRFMEFNGVTYVFLFFSEKLTRENRKQMLAAICFWGRGKYKKNQKVLGIATEMKINVQCSYDFCLIKKPDWTNDDQEKMEKLQKTYNLFNNPEIGEFFEAEYPM